MIAAPGFKPDVWFPLRPHKEQYRLWKCNKRLVGVAAGRQSGKTLLARRRVVRYLQVKKPWYDPMYAYVLPTVNQAKRVAWNQIKDLVPPHWIADKNESDMMIRTIYNTRLYVLGADKPERIEGTSWDGMVIDESCDQKPDLFKKSVLPALAHRDGWCWRIGVPKRSGIGAVDFKDFCEEKAEAFFTWSSEDVMPADKIQEAREQLDERDYNELYRATWESSIGAIFHAFDDTHNVSSDVTYRPDLPILVGSDFNVDPMCWVLCQVVGDVLHVFDEIFLRNTNTEATLRLLHEKYQSHTSGWQFYGDASASQRRTSASTSDYILIKTYPAFKNAGIYYPPANPRVADRFASTNARLRNAVGQIRILIHPRCKRLIADLKQRAYEPGSRQPDDYGDVGHITDALGYLVHRRWPISLAPSDAASGIISQAI